MQDVGEEKKKRPGSGRQNEADFSLKRQESMINSLNIFKPGFFELVQPEPKETPKEVPAASNYTKYETHGNVFKGFGKEPSQKISEPRVSLVQNYERQCLEYEKYLFDGRIKSIIKRMSIKAYSIFRNDKENKFLTYPIQRLLVAIAKKLLLNRFELLFLQYAFEETRWKYEIDCIKKHAPYFKSYIMLADSESLHPDIKLLEVYIVYCAYFSKKSLNQLPSDNMFLQFCIELCPRFKDFFPEWTSSSGTGSARINPKLLNTIFKRLTFSFDRDHEDDENFCLIVEEIIDISPAYNADKTGKQKKARKKKKEEKPVEQELQSRSQEDVSGSNRHRDIVQEEEQIEGFPEPPMFGTKISSVMSVDMLDPRHYITRNSSQHERR